MHEVKRIIGVFIQPKRAFEDIVAHPRWLAPLLLIIVLSQVAIFITSHSIDYKRVFAGQQQTEEDRQSAQLTTQLMTVAMPILAFVLPLVFSPIAGLSIAGVMCWILRRRLFTPVSFRQAFAVACYAGLPGAAGCIVTIVVALAMPQRLHTAYVWPSNLAALFDPKFGPNFITELAESIDIQTVWSILLLAVGFSAASAGKLSFRRTLMAVVAPWAVFVVVKSAVFAAIPSSSPPGW